MCVCVCERQRMCVCVVVYCYYYFHNKIVVLLRNNHLEHCVDTYANKYSFTYIEVLTYMKNYFFLYLADANIIILSGTVIFISIIFFALGIMCVKR